jgi:hypothetical protein
MMRLKGIAAKTERKSRSTTDSNHDHPVAENVVGRDFKPTAADRAISARRGAHRERPGLGRKTSPGRAELLPPRPADNPG